MLIVYNENFKENLINEVYSSNRNKQNQFLFPSLVLMDGTNQGNLL